MSNKSFIRILSAGPLCTVQDAGRFGYMKSGVGTSGVMDLRSYAEANYLVGNTDSISTSSNSSTIAAAVLETTLFGPTIEFTDPTIFALTGGDFKAKLDSSPVDRGRPYIAGPGQKLVLNSAVSGIRGYIAFHGGIDVPTVMGSCSTNLKCHMGGYEGRPVKAGDELPLGEGLEISKVSGVFTRFAAPAEYQHEITVRAIKGPQDDCFADEAFTALESSQYSVSEKSDRMGIRLVGPELKHLGKADIVSDGIVFGSIQVPANGQPIVLMADHQTTGGYTKIATVVSADLPFLAQARPGDIVKFRLVSVDEIQRELRNKAK